MSCGTPFIYNYFLSGDCSNTNSGVISFDITGSTSPPFSVTEISSSGLLPTSATTASYYFSGLSGGSYSLEIQDSCLTASTILVNFNISTGSCLSITSTTSTTCGFDNGSLTATFSVDYGNGEVFLYETTNGYITSGNTLFGSYDFQSLSAGTYYVVGNDGGGCTGKSETCIVKSSTTLDYGVYVIKDGSCVTSEGLGKIFVTGQTGTPPYTYSWSSNANGQTGSTVTGLTDGAYTVTVTDSNGCDKTISNIIVQDVPPVGIVGFTTISPACFTNNGVVDVQITGGTAPFYFSGSNGTVGITFDSSYTFSGLSSGIFYVNVTDAGLCVATSNISLITPNGFGIASITTQNSNCNNNDGQIFIELDGGSNSGTYVYSLVNSSGVTVDTVTQGTSYTSPALTSGDYTIFITNGTCTFTGTTTLSNTNLFTITTNVTGTTCGLNNGIVQILASSGGTLPYTYQVEGYVPGFITTYNNLPSGFYNITVTDAGGCSQTDTVFVNGSAGVYFDFFVNQPTLGSDGEITTMISSGVPPFTYNWSPNVNGQTGTTVTGLTAGTYTLEVIDASGCTFTKQTTLVGTTYYSSFETYNVCSSTFVNSGISGRRGVLQMFNEGYFDLTSGDTGCILNSATFTVDITIDGVNQQNVFYTSTGLNDYPTDNEWTIAIKNLLYSFSGITSVITNIETNEITIKSGCITGGTDCQINVETQLDDSNVIINLIINYDISCVFCGGDTKVFQDDVEFVFMDDINYVFQ